MTSKKWSFEHYLVVLESNLLRFEYLNGQVFGYVSIESNDSDHDLEAELDSGVCPITDGWEDGIGNTVSLFGWGEEYPVDLYDAYERLQSLFNTKHNGRYIELFSTADELLGYYEGEFAESFERKYGKSLDNISGPIVLIGFEHEEEGHSAESVDELITKLNFLKGQEFFD